MAKAPKPRIVNRKHQARLERERQQRRVLVYGSIGVAVLVIGLLLYGLLDQLVLRQNRTIASVGADRITVSEFQSRTRFARQQSIQQLAEMQQMAALFGDQGDAFFGGQIQSLVAQLSDAESIGDQVLSQMIDETVIIQEAAELGITVTEEEIDKAMRETFGFFPEGTPTAEPQVTLAPTSTLSALQQTLVPPTAIPTEAPTATAAADSEATEPAVTPTTTEDPATATPEATLTPFPTATPMTEEGYQEQLGTFVTSLEDIGFDENDLRDLIRTQLLWQKVFDTVTAD
ncbi:MAG TPA: SurA N-terminal domain-containing protein, partial [Anaerolineaceae bacterium]|nr:SurA N-terminal domain-containing protein [Anaerolineaceae bacterium]